MRLKLKKKKKKERPKQNPPTKRKKKAKETKSAGPFWGSALAPAPGEAAASLSSLQVPPPDRPTNRRTNRPTDRGHHDAQKLVFEKSSNRKQKHLSVCEIQMVCESLLPRDKPPSETARNMHSVHPLPAVHGATVTGDLVLVVLKVKLIVIAKLPTAKTQRQQGRGARDLPRASRGPRRPRGQPLPAERAPGPQGPRTAPSSPVSAPVRASSQAPNPLRPRGPARIPARARGSPRGRRPRESGHRRGAGGPVRRRCPCSCGRAAPAATRPRPLCGQMQPRGGGGGCSRRRCPGGAGPPGVTATTRQPHYFLLSAHQVTEMHETGPGCPFLP